MHKTRPITRTQWKQCCRKRKEPEQQKDAYVKSTTNRINVYN